MLSMRRLVGVVLFLSLVPFLQAQDDSPLVSVIPFEALAGVAENDAMALTLAFETALNRGGLSQVIEQNQVEDILETQRESLSGCRDESCAIELGKLLSAEQ